MRVALLCDIGHSVYHVGNEATAIASAAQLRKRGHEVVMISHDERPGPLTRLPRRPQKSSRR